jgi:hypothetical protein
MIGESLQAQENALPIDRLSRSSKGSVRQRDEPTALDNFRAS